MYLLTIARHRPLLPIAGAFGGSRAARTRVWLAHRAAIRAIAVRAIRSRSNAFV